MTAIERLWQEMEAEGGPGWRIRRARREAAHPLVVALEPHHDSRTLLVKVPGLVVPPRREWPECRGLEWLTVSLETVSYWGVRLRDPACADVFSALAWDLDARLAQTTSSEQAAAELFGRLKLWQQFLKACREGMSLEARRGLWGELYFLRAGLLPTIGADASVGSWKAGTAAHQDFQFPHAAVEVKTTSAKKPQNVRITSERQLDETGVGILFLVIVVVDEREAAMTDGTPGLSLPALVAAVRADLDGYPGALALFNDLLFHRGWLDEHAPRYESHRLTLREQLAYRVETGFPRLVEGDLPDGVGDVNYALSLSSCEAFQMSSDEMIKKLDKISKHHNY